MSDERTSREQAAAETGMELEAVRFFAELGLIGPDEPLAPQDMAELRRAVRIMRDLELEYDAAALLLRMRRRILALQHEVRRLHASGRARAASVTWVEAEWTELP